MLNSEVLLTIVIHLWSVWHTLSQPHISVLPHKFSDDSKHFIFIKCDGTVKSQTCNVKPIREYCYPLFESEFEGSHSGFFCYSNKLLWGKSASLLLYSILVFNGTIILFSLISQAQTIFSLIWFSLWKLNLVMLISASFLFSSNRFFRRSFIYHVRKYFQITIISYSLW